MKWKNSKKHAEMFINTDNVYKKRANCLHFSNV